MAHTRIFSFRMFGLGALMSNAYLDSMNKKKKSTKSTGLREVELKALNSEVESSENYSSIYDWIQLQAGQPDIREIAARFSATLKEKCSGSYSSHLSDEDRRTRWLGIRAAAHQEQNELMLADKGDTAAAHFLEELRVKIENVNDLKIIVRENVWDRQNQKNTERRVVKTCYLPPLLPLRSHPSLRGA